MALTGDVQKALVVVCPAANDGPTVTGLRHALVGAGFVVLREETRVLQGDTVFRLAAANPADGFNAVEGSARVLVVARNAVYATLAGFFAVGGPGGPYRSGVRYSMSAEAGTQRLLELFPRMSVDTIPTGPAAREFVDRELKTIMVAGLTACAKEKPQNPVKFFANYLLEHNPRRPPVEEPAAA